MIKTIIRSSVTTIVLFVAAAALIIIGSIGAAQASPAELTKEYGAEIKLSEIHVSLTENNSIVKGEDALLSRFKNQNGAFKIGDEYKEELAVKNVDKDDNPIGIPQYVRVTIKKYWAYTDEKGNVIRDEKGKAKKDPSLDPSLINLHLLTGPESGWIEYADVSSDKNPELSERKNAETTVLYYQDILQPGMSTNNFADTIRIDKKVLTDTKIDDNGNSVLAYKNRVFMIDVTVDAVQTHSGTEAMTSAWGRTNK